MRLKRSDERRAVILMVVLALLTLFAILGITFVLYADSEATSARIAREAENQPRAEVDPEQALAFALGQLIYDVPDTLAGVGSGLRGHSLARTMYGFNYTMAGPNVVIPGSNLVPFNGVGRLHYSNTLGRWTPQPGVNQPPDDYTLVNYTWFPTLDMGGTNGFFNAGTVGVRDPERFGVRQNPGFPQANPYVGGNVPYTYPDLNNFFLAAVKADGTVLSPSFFRSWTPFGLLGPTNPNWYTSSSLNPSLKYMVLRPRPADHNGFPAPEDAGGDVKNLVGAPGGNDSIWIDVGAPVMTAPDGRKYKMLVAPLIIDLDGRINLNTAGNILAFQNTSTSLASIPHLSNQGWGPWEVNLAKVLYGDTVAGIATNGSNTITVGSTAGFTPGDTVTVVGTNFPTPPNLLSTTITSMTATTITLATPWTYPPGGPTPVTVIDQEWTHLFTGRASGTGIIPGRYVINPGPPPSYTPTTMGATATTPGLTSNGATAFQLGAGSAPAGNTPHFYFPIDFNGTNESAPNTASNQITIPAGAFCFPTFPTTAYLNGGTENSNHPLLFDVFRTAFYNNGISTRTFRASEMEALLRPNSFSQATDAGNSALTSDLIRLCPFNFGPQAASRRYGNLVTTLSMDLGMPGVIPYWYNQPGANPVPNQYPFGTYPFATSTANPNPVASAPIGNVVSFPSLPPSAAITNNPPTNTSEFGPDWRAVSASLGRILLNRPLPPYPHMGYGLLPPFTAATGTYGTSYNLTQPTIANQYQAALLARQTLANDIYRRLLAVTGVTPIPPSAGGGPPASGTAGNPNAAQLAPRRWLAQLAVNIVDYMDDDDINTPFNFYTTTDGLPAAQTNATTGPTGVTTTPGVTNPDPDNTGINPIYWVYGTELPKVVLNEVLAQAQNPTPGEDSAGDQVNIWVELYNTMQTSAMAYTSTQQQDTYRVPLYMNPPAGGTGYSPYRVTITQYLMNQPPATAPATVAITTSNLPDVSANVLGKAIATTAPTAAYLPLSTTDVDFSPTNATWKSINGTAAPKPTNPASPYTGPGVDPQQYLLLGPQPSPAAPYEDPFNPTPPAGQVGAVPTTAVIRSASLQYSVGPTTTPPTWTATPTTPDERTTGLTVLLRRLANPYLPYNPYPLLPNGTSNPNYNANLQINPYVTVDSIQNVPIQSLASATTGLFSRAKRQPYAGYNLVSYSNPTTIPIPQATQLLPTLGTVASAKFRVAPVVDQLATSGAMKYNDVNHTFGAQNLLAPQVNYDWLVHLDRQVISPIELLHVSAYQPYQLTQQFVNFTALAGCSVTSGSTTVTVPSSANLTVGDPVYLLSATSPSTNAPLFTTIASITNATTIVLTAAPTWTDTLATLYDGGNPFRHYAPWLDGQPNTSVVAPWWYDSNLTLGQQSHRLYRLLEFLECGDRAYGVNGLGRIPGRVNINTLWDQEPLQAIIDASASLGLTSMPPQYSSSDPTVTVFNNMLQSRTPNLTSLSGTDRPFLPLSAGLNLVGTPTAPQLSQYPNNGTSVTQDTLFRLLSPNNQSFVFQNTSDTVSTHPYLQTQWLTKLYNNVTTRSNVFAVWLTIGFFEVTDATTVPPTLGPEMGRSEGRQVRHRMFAIVDRTNLNVFTTTTSSPVTAPSLNVVSPYTTPPTTQATLTLNLYSNNSVTATNVTSTGALWTIAPGTQLVVEPGTENEETIVVQSVTMLPASLPLPNQVQITANFIKPHPLSAVTGNASGTYTIMQRGNPGPWTTRYDPRLDPLVVPHYNIID